MKKLLAVLLALFLVAGLSSCKARTGVSEKEEEQKGARENWVVSENPRIEPEQTSSEPESESEPEKDEKPQELVSNLLYASRTGERAKIQPYADFDTLFGLQANQGVDWTLYQILTRMTYEVLSSTVDGDKASVTVKITNVDMNVVLPKYFTQAMNLEFENAMAEDALTPEALDKEYQKMFAALMSSHETGKIEKLVDVEVLKKDGEWKITPETTLGNAMLGGYIDAKESAFAQVQLDIPAQPDNAADDIQVDENGYPIYPDDSE